MKLEKYLWKYLVKHGEKLEEPQKHCHGCGSCRYYDFSYASQLEGKRLWVEQQMKEKLEYAKPIEIVASPKQKYYRGRMDFIATKGMIGMRRSGGFNNVYDVTESCIYAEDIGAVLEKLRGFKKYPDYDLITHEGIIRYFVTRQSIHNSQTERMLAVVVSTLPEEFSKDLESFLKSVDLWDYFNVVCIIAQPSLADLSYGIVDHYLKGETIKQDLKVGEKVITLEIGPQSFFQANVSMFEKVLEYMKDSLNGIEYKEIYDLYGGVGSIGIGLANTDSKLIMAENNPDNTVLFARNAKNNRLNEYDVFEGTVDDFLNKDTKFADSLVVFDPPRIGLEKKVIEKFLRKDNLPEKIIYMSCNPSSQADDLKLLHEKYEITEIKAFDMFPYASHVEAVAILELRG